MKTAVIYHSVYGASRQYAEWLAQELNADLMGEKKAKLSSLSGYDTLLFGGGLYAGKIRGTRLLKKYFEQICGKQLVVFTVGLADPEEKENAQKIRADLEKIFSPEQMEKLHVFHLRGAINVEKLGPVHKLMMAMLRKMLLQKPRLTEQDRQLLASYDSPVSFVRKETIGPVVRCVRNFEQG